MQAHKCSVGPIIWVQSKTVCVNFADKAVRAGANVMLHHQQRQRLAQRVVRRQPKPGGDCRPDLHSAWVVGRYVCRPASHVSPSRTSLRCVEGG